MDSRKGDADNAGFRLSQEQPSLSKKILNDEQRFSERILLVIDSLSGHILDASIAAVHFYGYPFERLISMKITEINTLPYFVVMKKRLEAAKNSRSNFIFPHRLADGRVRDVEVISKAHSVDGKRYLLSEIKDITDTGRATG